MPSLCPAAEVQAHTGTNAAPTTISIEKRFYDHVAKTLSLLGGPIRLLHYVAGGGAEGAGGYYEISAATNAEPSVLTVSSVGGGAVLAAHSYLTLPASADCSTYQSAFAHVGNGSIW
jgi:hypothetical protein